MSTPTHTNEDFYIGWQEQAPASIGKAVRNWAIAIAVLAATVAASIVISQRGFAPSVFEFGTLSEVEGVLAMTPAPMLKVYEEDQVTSILLVGFGKFGAERDLEKMEAQQQQTFAGKLVKLRGTKIYHDGKMALELTEGVDAFVSITEPSKTISPQEKQLGTVSLRGEILDPKCALGVMNPAEGKPHRSCAIRCISGGIPPLLRLTDAQGATNYVLLRGKPQTAINQEVLPYVADQIQICGDLVQEDDWLVLYTDPQADIVRLLPHGVAAAPTTCGQ